MVDYTQLQNEATALLQQLIQNKCVNDESPESGNEMRSVETLLEYFKSKNVLDKVEHEVFKTAENRGNLLLRLRGESNEESLMYESHLDVVPVNEDNWDVDPFSAEIKDGVLYGRGTVDMLLFTATQAVAFAELVSSGFKPKRDLVFLAVADEEGGASYGAKWLVENVPEKIMATYLIGEFGGAVLKTDKGSKTALMIAEKGPSWFKIKVKGTSGHASFTYMTDNAIFTTSEILKKIRDNPPPAFFTPSWNVFIKGLGLGSLSRFMLTHKVTLDYAINKVSKKDLGLAKTLHALTHMTINPTIMKAGTKTNIIPDSSEVSFDVRLLPGQDFEYLQNYLRTTLGPELMSKVEIVPTEVVPGSADSWDTPLIDTIREVYGEIEPDKELIPLFLPAVTDSRYFRKIGIKCYGFSILTDKVELKDLMSMAHGDNEGVPLEAIGKTVQFFYDLPLKFLV